MRDSRVREDVMDASYLGEAAVLSLLAVVAYLLYKTRARRLEGIPGPEATPLFGNISELLQMDAADVFVSWTKEYGKVLQYSVALGGTFVLVADAEGLKRVLCTNCRNYPKASAALSVVRRIFGPRCMISLAYDEHEERRRIVSPAFKRRALEAMLPAIGELTSGLLDRWSSAAAAPSAGGSGDDEFFEVAVQEDVASLTVDVLGKCILGHDFGCLRGNNEPVSRAIYRVMSVEDLSWLRVLPFYDYLPTAWNRDIKMVKHFAAKVLQLKKQTAAADRATGGETASATAGVLDLLLKARDEAAADAGPGGQPVTDGDVVDDLVLFLIAGHETLIGVLCWALLKVAQRPDVQSRCREEAVRVLPPEGDEVSHEHVSRLKFCAAVIKETLRLHTSVPLTVRTAVEEDVVCGYRIPAGTCLTLGLAAMMRHPDYYSEPDTFAPDRFLDVDESQPHFLPFISGPSTCIGRRFALLEMVVILSALVRRFELRPIPGVTYKGKQGLTYQMQPPLRLLLSRVAATPASPCEWSAR